MKIKSTLILLFSFASFLGIAEELSNLSVNQLIDMQKNNNALIIDIRTEKEWLADGVIPGSSTLQFFSATGKYNAEKWLAQLNQLKTSTDQPVILVCRSGNRSGRVGNMLANQLNLKNIYHLSTGIQSWIKAGKKTTSACPTHLACR